MNYDYLLADLKRPYPSHPIWIEHLAKRVMFCLFLGLQTPLTPPPLPYGGNGRSLLTRGCSLQKKFLVPPMLLFNSIFSQHTARNINYLHKQQIA